MQEQVQEYFNNYFGQELNESISDDQIMEAVYDLIALRDAVLEAVGDIFGPSGHEPASGWTITDKIKSPNIMKKLKKRSNFLGRIKSRIKKSMDKHMAKRMDKHNPKHMDKHMDKRMYQKAGHMDKMDKRMGHKGMMSESVEPLEELEAKTLQSYMTKIHKKYIKGQQTGGSKKTIKAIKGFIKAKKKLSAMGAKTPAVIDGVIQGDKLDKKKLGTGNVHKADTVQGKKITTEGIWKDTKGLVKDLIRNPRKAAPKKGDPDFQPLIKKKPKSTNEEISANSRKILEIMAKKKKDYPKQSERARKMLKRIDDKSKQESVNNLGEGGGEYDPEYEHDTQARDAVQDAERKKGEKLTSAEREHHEKKAYHDIGYRNRNEREIESKEGKKLTYAEMNRAKRRATDSSKSKTK